MTRVYVRRPMADRFWEKVNRDGPLNERLGSKCWLWAGKARHDFGYGMFTVSRAATIGAHRVAWLLTFGPIPPGAVVRHACDNPPCCNPAHLLVGTVAENNADAKHRGRTARGFRSGHYTKPDRTPRGVAAGRSKLTPEGVRSIRARAAAGEGPTAIARDHGVTPQAIAAVVKRKAWGHIE